MNNKAVMFTEPPQRCELIASGKCTMLVFKTRPKLEPPFVGYIYATKGSRHIALLHNKSGISTTWCCDWRTAFPCNCEIVNGFVIGEFVCDRIDEYPYSTIDGVDIDDDALLETCLDWKEINVYAKGQKLFGIHISALKIYDTPKELGEFWKTDKCPYNSNNCCTYQFHCYRAGEHNHKYGRCGEKLTRPPQSYCYVEQLNEVRV